MVEDHFAHSIVPPRPPSKRPLQVLVVVAILLAVTALVVYYWPLFSTFTHSVKEAIPSVLSDEPEQSQPLNTDQKEALLKQVTAEDQTASTTGLTLDEKQQLLQSVAPTPTSSSNETQTLETQSETPKTQKGGLTLEEKQKLLQATE